MSRETWSGAACRWGIWLLGWMLGASAVTWADGFVHVAPRPAGFTEGELLLGELNCVVCHTAPPAIRQRLNSRGAPVLGAGGLQVTPQWLRRWLANPAGAKAGSGMPDVLHGVPEAQRGEVADSLTQFLISLAPTTAPAAVRADPSRVESGRVLFHSIGCVSCHAPQDREAGVTPEIFERARSVAVPLVDLATKYPAGELVRFLLDPVKHRPGGRMPSLSLTETEATSLATYLLREQLADIERRSPAAVAGLQFEYFAGRFDGCADFEKRQPTSSGIAATVDPKVTSRPGDFGLRFQGILMVPADGEYAFSLNSDDGSQLYLDGQRLIDIDGEHPPTERSAPAKLKAGPHGFSLLFYQNGGGYELNLRWSGPGFSRQEIPASAFRHFARPMLPVGEVAETKDPVKAAQGRDWFTKLNCASCHEGTGVTPTTGRPLLELSARVQAGCLADSVPAGAPRFDLTTAQRQALREAVSGAARLAEPLSAAGQVAQTMTRLNCYACHARDGVGGPLESGRADWFRVVGEADLGDEGRLPPHLTAVGAKLKPAWLQQLLSEGTKVRPYMATRMPRFGATHATALQAALLQADQRADAAAEPVATAREGKLGWKLVGRDGLSCIACHTFTTFGSTGIPALGLDAMARRLQWDWFRRYLPDPAALRPGTRMPTFWPEGHAVNTAILGGRTDAQIQAIWAWLQDGPKAEVPTGLTRGRHELVVDAETVIYRNFIEGAGSRAIGVGYPEHANLAFDANELRLALLWQGSFIDISRHSTDRGVGYEPPLGDHRIVLPAGPAFAALTDAQAAWPAAPDRLSGVNRFLGYTLDAQQRPTFRYRIGGVTVEETPRPRAGEVDLTLVRHFRFTGTADRPLYLRVAKGAIVAGAPGEFNVEQKLKVKFDGPGTAKIVGSELRVPVPVPGEFNLEMTW